TPAHGRARAWTRSGAWPGHRRRCRIAAALDPETYAGTAPATRNMRLPNVPGTRAGNRRAATAGSTASPVPRQRPTLAGDGRQCGRPAIRNSGAVTAARRFPTRGIVLAL